MGWERAGSILVRRHSYQHHNKNENDPTTSRVWALLDSIDTRCCRDIQTTCFSDTLGSGPSYGRFRALSHDSNRHSGSDLARDMASAEDLLAGRQGGQLGVRSEERP